MKQNRSFATKIVFALLLVGYSAHAEETCAIDANKGLGATIKLATFSGKMSDLIEKRDMTGACYEVGLMMGRVQAVKDSLFPACTNSRKLKISLEINKCQTTLASLKEVCKQENLQKLSTNDQFSQIKDIYNKGLECLDQVADGTMGLAK